jgi:UDP-glucose 4-epimerase
MRTLVTGAAGFIGSTLVDRLLADGHQVVGVDNLSTGSIANLENALLCKDPRLGKFTFADVDIQAPEFADIVAGANPDVVFHLAAQVDLRASVADPLFDARNNVLGTINVLEACVRAGVTKIVYAASGGSRYGAPSTLPVAERATLDPLSPYAASKVAGEMYMRAYAGMYPITSVCLGLANVYGPRQNPHGEAGVIAVFGSAMIIGRDVSVFGDGTATRDYVYVDDVVEAFVRAGIAPPSAAGIYNVGTGKQTSVAEVHRLIADALGRNEGPNYAPARTGEVQASALDATKAGADFGWKPRVEVAEGITRTVRWLQATLASEPASLAG